MQILYRGAESVIYLDEHDGEAVLVKERIKKSYRIAQLDERLRKERTRKEVKLLTDARALGIPTPQILFVDEKSHKIFMEYVEGLRLKDFLDKGRGIVKVCKEIGRLIGKLHTGNIVHGDLTTSNVILHGSKIYFIDFSLGNHSQRVEDKATDLNLLRSVLKSTHFKVLKTCWNNILKGYKAEYKDAEKVIERIDEIERRARYKDRGDRTGS